LGAQTGKALFNLEGANIIHLAFSLDGKRLTGGNTIWDAQTGQFLLSHGSVHDGQVSFSSDGHRLAVVKDCSNEVTIYDATPLPEKP
jgi:hypothetical protein